MVKLYSILFGKIRRYLLENRIDIENVFKSYEKPDKQSIYVNIILIKYSKKKKKNQQL